MASARAAQSQYAAAYASVVNLGKAVPPSQEVPALIDQLAQATNQKNVELRLHHQWRRQLLGRGGGRFELVRAASIHVHLRW